MMFPALNLHYPPFFDRLKMAQVMMSQKMIKAVVFWRGFTQIKGPGALGITGSRRGRPGNQALVSAMQKPHVGWKIKHEDWTWLGAIFLLTCSHLIKVWLLESIRQWVLDQKSTFGCLMLKFFLFSGYLQGLVNVPFWEYWTSPYSSHLVDHIPNGWVMFNGDI